MINIIFTTLYAVAVVAQIFFLYFLLRQPQKKAPVKVFFVLIGLTLFWTALEIVAPLNLFGLNVSLYLWRLSFFVSGLITFLVLLSVSTIVFKKIYYWSLPVALPVYAYLFYLTVVSGAVIKSVIPGKKMWEAGYAAGDKFGIVVAIIAVPLFASIILAFYRFFVLPRGEEKKQVTYILVGLFFPAIAGVTTNLFLPLLRIEAPRVANLSGVVLAFFIYLSIHKYGAYGGRTRRYSIKARLTFAFVMVSFIAGMAAASVFYQVINDFLKEQLSGHLKATTQERAIRIDHFLKDQKDKIEHLAGSLEARGEISRATSTGAQYKADLLEEEELGGDTVFSHFYEIFVLNKNGIVVDSTSERNEGKDLSGTVYFLEGAHDTYIKDAYHSETTDKNSLALSSPIKGDSGDLGGIIVGRIDATNLNKITLSTTGLGETGEVYLVNEEGYMITPSRFRGDTFLKEKVNTVNTEKCFGQKQGFNKIDSPDHFFGTFSDYRGKSVLGTYAYIPEMEWCLLTEADTAEFFGFYKDELKYYYLLGFLILFLVSAGFGYLFSYTISRPILRLKKEVEKAGKTNFRHKIEEVSRDEIGRLAGAFNNMIKEVRASKKDAEEIVEKQTKEIEDKRKELENQQKAILNVLEDVSEEKEKTEQEKDKIKAILYSIGDGVFVIDKNFKINVFNTMAEKISGYSSKEAVGKRYDEVLRFVNEKEEEDRKEFIEKPMETGEIREMSKDTVLINKKGEKIPVADSAAPLKDKDGNILGCVVVFRDVTQERQIDKAKTEFVSLASHQLRTPLSSINWYAEMLINGDAGKLNEEQKEFLEQIYKGNQRMVDLVNALLNVSRIELGTLAVSPESINFKDTAESVLNELKHSIKEKKLKINKKYDKNIPNVKADPNLIRIIFQNLLSNSVKYTPEKGKVDLTIKNQKKYLSISVSDSGYGIPKKEQDKIFTKMFRADNVKEKDAEGTGLGLYIVKAIIEQAGGKIWFKSAKNKGTTFYVKFPKKGMEKKEGSKTLNPIS